MKIKPIYIAVIVIIAVFIGFILLFKSPSQSNNTNGVPQQPVHWHPKLKIMIKGEEQFIPPNIGISIGNNIDNQISGMRMSPTHTHESDGTIHLENNRPWQKPETLTLGYFFKVWGRNFNSSCIFEYCNGENGTLKITVNGKENFEFNKYIMHDKDEIVIEYK
ncbi:hypothetical protein HYW20_04370 [Candidatus Woesearchaeota archaeon]|nr:hypothetical protein [Candidatus Woesearchaeota archaeon]